MEVYNKQSDEKGAEYLLAYINGVLLPSSQEFFTLLEKNEVSLHHAFSFNAILAHAIDYMVFLAKKMSDVSRKDFILQFDEKYSVDGCLHISNKFRLLDAVNNSFKHVELEHKRYSELIEVYGNITFHSLVSKNGKIFFVSPSHIFDYCRVVMRPIAAIFDCDLISANDVDAFIKGRIYGGNSYGDFDYDYEPHDAIDRMIDACNPECLDCGEGADDCDCTNFTYGDKKGEFSSDADPSFNFDDVMSDISGTRDWNN